MFKNTKAFSSFSVDDLAKAKEFYKDILGLNVTDANGMGLIINLASGGKIFIYDKENHTPASCTLLNFPVENIDKAVAELEKRGIQLEHYDNMHQDEKGIFRGKASGEGPDVAWFTDPAGNVLSILVE